LQICNLGPKLLLWNFLQISQLSTKWGARTFSTIFEVIEIFNNNFAKVGRRLAAEMGTIVYLKGQSLPENNAENTIKIYKRRQNSCSKYIPLQ